MMALKTSIDQDGENHLDVDPAVPHLVVLHRAPRHVPVLPHQGDVDVLEGVNTSLQQGIIFSKGRSCQPLEEVDGGGVSGHDDPEEAEVLADTETSVPGVAGRVVLLPVPPVQLRPEYGGRVVEMERVGGAPQTWCIYWL